MRRVCFLISLLFLAAALFGCSSHGVVVTIQNDSGVELRNVEVQYPGGSFGKASLAPRAAYTYRVKILRAGQVSTSFEDANARMHQTTGPSYSANADGVLLITIHSPEKVLFTRH